jgi:uncharacterized protein (DUF2147 family)
MKTMLRLIFALTAVFVMKGASAQDPADAIVGSWFTGNGDAKINIFKSGESYYGSIVWLKNPLEDGKPKVDKHNPDEKLRNKPLLGLMLLRGFRYDGDNVWVDGKIYDPKSGKDYSCKMTLTSKDKLGVRGYIGISLIGRTDTWTKATP